MAFANKDNLTSSFQIWMPFISVFCLIALTRTSSDILAVIFYVFYGGNMYVVCEILDTFQQSNYVGKCNVNFLHYLELLRIFY
jgi:hypothetical protein